MRPQQVVSAAARNRAKIGVRCFRIMREVVQLIGPKAGSLEQLIGPRRHPAPPQLDEHVR